MGLLIRGDLTIYGMGKTLLPTWGYGGVAVQAPGGWTESACEAAPGGWGEGAGSAPTWSEGGGAETPWSESSGPATAWEESDSGFAPPPPTSWIRGN